MWFILLFYIIINNGMESIKLLHLDSYKTPGIINLFDTDHEPKLNILNWYLHWEHAGEVDPTLV
jgi:hypothetical protein